MNSKSDKSDKIMTAEEVSEYLRLPITTVYGLASRGRIRASKCGRQWRFLEKDVVDYLNGNRPEPRLPQSSVTEKRKYARIKTQIPAKLTGLLNETQDLNKDGIIRDISEGGLLFVSDGPLLGIGHPVRLMFSIPGDTKNPVGVEGRIVHQSVNGKACVGIKFRMLAKEVQERIRVYVG